MTRKNTRKSKHKITGAELLDPNMRLDIHELILDSGAVTAMVWSAPGHYASICQNRSKSTACSTNLLPQLVSDFRAVTAKIWMAPGHHASICQDCSKSTACATNMLNVPQLILECGAVTTIVWSAPGPRFHLPESKQKHPKRRAQVTTLPSARIAAKALSQPLLCS